MRRLCLTSLLIAAGIIIGVDRQGWAQSATAVEFSRLSEEDQLAYLQETLLQFRHRTNNLSATTTRSMRNVPFDPETDEIGEKILQRGSTYTYELRRIGDSYRVSRHREAPESQKEPGVIYDTTDIEGYDPGGGRRRQYTIAPRDDAPPLLGGLISSVRSRKVAASCHFFEFLGHHDPDGDISVSDPGSRFLRNIEDAHVTHINVGTGVVEVRFPATTSWAANVKCRIAFDLNRGALLIRSRFTEVSSKAGREVEEYWNNLEVLGTRRVGDVWVPTKMRQTVWSGNYPKEVTIHETAIKDVQLNELTKADLAVVFPPGTEVRNEITGERFKIDPDGKRAASTIRRRGPASP